jgi:hypothetical protein
VQCPQSFGAPYTFESPSATYTHVLEPAVAGTDAIRQRSTIANPKRTPRRTGASLRQTGLDAHSADPATDMSQ